MMPDRFDMTNVGEAPRFPAVRLTSLAEFRAFREERRDLLDARFGLETSYATREARLTQAGTCAVCLRPAIYHVAAAHGHRLADGRMLPNWRETMRCDCAAGLINRQRALLHLLQVSGVAPWMRALALGPPDETECVLRAMVNTLVQVPRLTTANGAPHLDAASARCHVAVSQDYLQVVPPLDAALAELCRCLVPGGSFIFTVPFHADRERSEAMPDASMAFTSHALTEFRGAEHALGWDILDRLRAAGFGDAAAYCYWSQELGYLGALNMIFRAVR